MDVSLVQEPDRLLAVLRRTVPAAQLGEFYDGAYRTVLAALAAEGLEPAGPALAWIRFEGAPGPEFDIAAGFPVEGREPVPLAGEVEIAQVRGGPALVAEHHGDYAGLPAAWRVVEEQAVARGLVPRGEVLETYLTPPVPGGDPAQNRTRLTMLVR